MDAYNQLAGRGYRDRAHTALHPEGLERQAFHVSAIARSGLVLLEACKFLHLTKRQIIDHLCFDTGSKLPILGPEGRDPRFRQESQPYDTLGGRSLTWSKLRQANSLRPASAGRAGDKRVVQNFSRLRHPGITPPRTGPYRERFQ